MKSQYILSGIVVSRYILEVRKLPKCKVVTAAHRIYKTEPYSRPYIVIEDVFMERYAASFKSKGETSGLIVN